MRSRAFLSDDLRYTLPNSFIFPDNHHEEDDESIIFAPDQTILENLPEDLKTTLTHLVQKLEKHTVDEATQGE